MWCKQYCKNYQDIENYEKALADDFKGWHCHHRLETHTPDGERRDVDIGYKELKALGLYYNRPAEELIFLTSREHNAFKKGKQGCWKGKHHTEEAKKKMAESHKGKNLGNTAAKGKRWFNNGKINIRAKECPPGFIPGMLK